MGIHHPKGAQKKIAIENSIIQNYPDKINWSEGPTSPKNTHWRVYFDKGTVEGGSSGSPLLNQNRHVIGQLHGGANGCPPNIHQYYGRLDVSWNGNSAGERLRDWLDPIGSNQSTMDGRHAFEIYGPDEVCSPVTYSLSSNGQASSWGVSDPFWIISQSATEVTVETLDLTGQSGIVLAMVDGVPVKKTIRSCKLSISGPDVITGSCRGAYTVKIDNGMRQHLSNPRWTINDPRISLENNGINGCVVTRPAVPLYWPGTSSGSSFSNPLATPTITFTYNLWGQTHSISKTIQLAPKLTIEGVYSSFGGGQVTYGYAGNNYFLRGNVFPSNSGECRWTVFYVEGDGTWWIGPYLHVGTFYGTQTSSFSFPDNRTYTIELGVRDGCQYDNKTSISFRVEKALPPINPPITPPWIIPTDPILPGWGFSNVYPNPANSTLHLTVSRNESTSTSGAASTNSTNNAGASQQEPAQYVIQLVSVQTGVVAYNRPITNLASELSIDVSAVANGWYVLRLLRNNEIVQTQNILVMH